MSFTSATHRRSVAAVIGDAARPHLGITSRQQLRARALTDEEINGAVASGLLVRVHQGVFRVGGVPDSPRRAMVAACLAAGPDAAVGHRSGWWLWVPSAQLPPIEIVVPYGSHPVLAGVNVRRSLDLRPDHVIERNGIPVTRPARTLVDLGAAAPKAQVTAAVELALVKRLVTVAGLRAMLDDVGGRGRRGAGVLRAVLDERALGDVRAESAIEPLLARLMTGQGVGPVLFQPVLVLEGRVVRPDFGIPEALVVVEIDGLSVHGSRAALDHDLERQNLFMRNGYLVLRYTATHLRQPARVASEILRTARERRQQLLSLAS